MFILFFNATLSRLEYVQDTIKFSGGYLEASISLTRTSFSIHSLQHGIDTSDMSRFISRIFITN